MSKNNNFRKGELALKVLEILSKGALGLENVADRLLTPGFGYKGRLTRNQIQALYKRRRERIRRYFTEEELLREKHKVAVLMSRFKKAGLVKGAISKSKKSIWKITTVGLAECLRLKKKLERTTKEKLPIVNYKVIKSKHPIVVIFDVAEKEKYKRVWLRFVLANFSFRMLQKSVWIGNNQLPPEFIEDLRRLKLFDSVKVFSVFEEGSISEC